MAKKKERKVSTAAKGVTEGAENGGDDEDRTIITTNIGGGGGGGGSGGDPMNGTTVNGGDEDDDNDSGDLWDLVRVLSSPPTPSESESVANATCRMDGCNNKAIVVWAQQRHPEDEWPMCETCQESEFGGWPNVVEGRPTVTADEPATEQETKVSHTEQHMDATDSAKTELGKDDRHDEPEVWDLKTILSVQDITEKASKCSTDTCNLHAACIWVSNQAPSEDWFTCLDCQETDFGGFPPEKTASAIDPEHFSVMSKLCSRQSKSTFLPTGGTKTPGKSDTAFATITPAAPNEDDDVLDNEEEREEVWDLKQILSIQSLLDFPVKCSTETCSLPAACVWISNNSPTEKWYSCLDCQAKDFGGWPPAAELPVTHLTQEHLTLLAQKCSRQKSLDMPSFSTASPGHETRDSSSHLVAVTPMPGQQDGEEGDFLDDNAGPIPLQKLKKPAQPSKQALELHRKWQEAAEAMGGKDARIIVSAPAAKQVIFELLEGFYGPMNITDIHKGLKATVPPPVLKACLDEMVECSVGGTTFADSDDEDEQTKSKTPKGKGASGGSELEPKHLFKASLCFKAGKTASSSLYYVDYSKLTNNGNGLEPHARNELAADLAKEQAEASALSIMINQMTAEATKLLSEPSNEEASSMLLSKQTALDELLVALEGARKFKVNEKHKIKVKQHIDYMASQWRKRRCICMDFLITMEEVTDGSVSMKKCLAGDGPIDIDSDEAVAKGAVAFATKKRSASAMVKKLAPVSKKAKTGTADGRDSMASKSFVAVALDSQGRVSRVFLDGKSEV